MRKTLAKRALHRRIIALVAAYAIALASVVASFGAAQAAGAAAQSDLVICHSNVADQQTPASDQGDGKLCADCCIGCITSMGAAAAPNAPAVVVPAVVAAWPGPLAHSFLLTSVAGKAHRSRGPPPVL